MEGVIVSRTRKTVIVFMVLYILSVSVLTFLGIGQAKTPVWIGTAIVAFVTMVGYIISFVKMIVEDGRETERRVRAKYGPPLVEG